MHLTIKTAACLCWLIQLLAHSKTSAQNERLYAIEPVPLEVSASRTVSLSFSAPVKSLDRGSADLLAQKAKSTENVVLLKAARPQMQPTSLIVITADGELHTFEVRYQEQPSSLGLHLFASRHQPHAAELSEGIDQSVINEGIGLAVIKKPNLDRRRQAAGFSASIDGYYVKGPVMFLRLKLENRSVIDYRIQTLRVFTTDKKQIKRSASQRDELSVIGSSERTDQVKAGEKKTLVLAIAKLTIPENKRLSIGITEANGARNLAIDLKKKHISRIAPL
ncbi:conjugative transposon protein TraN [Dyadobacter sp. CY261]|uniref:conjugative transposon protein TraN n=1 Tax=Dyadobacter sp. CY261 TaxID=2907203 RepID=UPI001F2BBC0C|nr:conjugative transposon protein TraN [Dyadobacter sp. CY261]MCF0075394.1 conjugative transposon protein TraN [Dyadobacter sp. CY261]